MNRAVSIGTVGKTTRMGRRIAVAAACIALLLAIVAGASALYMSYVPSDLDLSRSRLTENGLYRVAYAPSPDPIPINELHAWTVHVATADGAPVEDAAIAIDGDMPQHGHGLPTEPRVTENLGDGRYLVEGVKFQMGGWWVMDFEVSAGGRSDRVRFDFVLP